MPDDGHASSFGDTQVVSIPQPAAGAGFTYTVSGAERELLLAVTFQLVSDANAATRTVRVLFRDSNGVTFAAVAAPHTQTATHTVVYSLALGMTAYGDDDTANIGGSLPYLPLDVGDTVVVSIANVQAGDQVSSARVFKLQEHVRA